MATYSIPKIKQSVFNSSNYIDTGYLTKSEADDLYINELPESVEKLIGNINIVGEETVSSQVVTGNCVINGNLTSGQDGFDGTTATRTVIKGNVTLGDQNNTSTETIALGKVTIGWTQPVNIRGSEVYINSATTNGTTATTIGNGSNPLTVNTSNCLINTNTGATGCTIGRSSNTHTTNIQGNVNIGLAGSGCATTLNGNVTLTNNLTVNGSATIGATDPIIINGSYINQNTSATSGNLLVGRSGLAPNAGQKNTLLSSQNLIYTPRLCDNAGNLLGQNFNLNNPSHFVFNQNLKYSNNAYTYCETSTVKNIVFYLNTPTLVANQCYTMCFEFFYYLIAGRGVSGGASVTPVTNALTSTATVGTASKVIQSCFMLVLAKASGGDGAYTFSCINTTQSSNPFIAFAHTGAQSGTTTTPLGFSKGTTDGRIAITIQFPQMANNTYSTTTDLMISMGCSLRLTNSNVNGIDLTGNNRGLYPNNSTDSSGGSAFMSLA
jgi:hypothetical protein